MRRLIAILVLLTTHAVAADAPTSCPALELSKAQRASLNERRHATFEHCLACQGDRCQLKSWPEEAAQFRDLCKVFFCAARKIPRSTFLDIERETSGAIRFTYSIGKDGRADEFEVTEIVGDLTEREAIAIARAMYQRRRYEPIVINGTSYVLANLADLTRYRATLELRAR